MCWCICLRHCTAEFRLHILGCQAVTHKAWDATAHALLGRAPSRGAVAAKRDGSWTSLGTHCALAVYRLRQALSCHISMAFNSCFRSRKGACSKH